MHPYSRDLREKVIRAYDEQCGSQRRLASLCGVSRSLVEQWLPQRRRTGTMGPRPHAGGRQPHGAEAAVEGVRQVWREQADAPLVELQERRGHQRGVWVRVSTSSRLRRRLGLPRNNRRFTPPNVTRRGSKRRAQTTGR